MGEKKRKPQITLSMINKNGTRLHIAADMGFGDEHWAKIKSGGIIDPLCELPFSWIRLIIDHTKEAAFTKQLERIFKAKSQPNSYLVVRAESGVDQGIDSHYFIHGLDINTVQAEASQYSNIPPWRIQNKKLLRQVLQLMFDVEAHPSQPYLRRWEASRYMENQLRISRMHQLINMAREDHEHPLVDRVPKQFDTMAARYIKSDRPLMYRLKLVQVFLILVYLEKTRNLLTRDEVIDIMTKLLQQGNQKWENEGFYVGLPKHGAERDEKQGRFVVYKGVHNALTIPTELLEESAWQLDVPIEVLPGEENLK